MVIKEITIKCPFCGSEDVSPHGQNATGKRVYHCKNPLCQHKYFVETYTKNGFNPKVREEVLKLTVNGNGTRAIAWSLGISKNTVTAILKKRNLG